MQDVSQLSGNVKGEVILPEDDRYDEARKVWNGMIDKRPALIVRCKNEDDVVVAVNYARDNNLITAVRGGGHNVAGFGTCDGGLVIDLSGMKNVSIDPEKGTADAQGGVTWREFDEECQKYGMATTGGLVSTTGLGGFTLGGGFGWLVRKYGMTIDNLISADIITAGGEKVTASDHENQDLFWGIRGGGGNFGVVTNFRYKVHNIGREVYGGAFFYPIEQAKEVLKAYRSWLETVPDDATTLFAFLTAPPIDFVPKELHGKLVLSIGLCYLGTKEEGEKLVSRLREAGPALDMVGWMPYIALQKMLDPFNPKGIKSYWKTSYLKGIEDDAIDQMIEGFKKVRSPMSQMHIHQMGGAVTRKGSESGAFTHRDEPFVLNVVALWEDPSLQEGEISWVRNTWNAMQRYSTGAAYLNFLGNEGSDRVKAAYGENYPRLVELKKKYDPGNFFRLNQNISPK